MVSWSSGTTYAQGNGWSLSYGYGSSAGYHEYVLTWSTNASVGAMSVFRRNKGALTVVLDYDILAQTITWGPRLGNYNAPDAAHSINAAWREFRMYNRVLKLEEVLKVLDDPLTPQ